MSADRARTRAGLVVAISASLAFSTSGTIAKPLLEAGWSPAAVGAARLLIAAVVLAIPGILALRTPGALQALWGARLRVVLYGTIAVTGTQLCYFAAIQRIPVGLALLIEYLAPIGLLLFMWMRTRRRPATIVLIGSGLALLGLVLVIGADGDGGIAFGSLDPIGLLYSITAAVGVAVYYVLGAVADDGVPPVAFAASTILLGGLVTAALAAVGVLPWHTTAVDVRLLGAVVPWFAPVIAIGVVSTAFAYVAGIVGSSRLGARTASFLGLLEVVFAVALSWIVLGEALGPIQLLGGALILGGIAMIRPDETRAVAVAPTDAGAAVPVGSVPLLTGAIPLPHVLEPVAATTAAIAIIAVSQVAADEAGATPIDTPVLADPPTRPIAIAG
ncbi:DMT family transporter [Schumannella sp. 10F1B-5-1]|uniref:EamA family transporter n=1 Tax=Schumannella sp. 10F1B-5-1 TaxID=2590780 RepID=UPI0011307193|nr:EamA family transporter [Schumannella sp. 10F1B-5-1]TPW73049.1 EamA family transporter [Schumannella sp. 10F1B-5-1]